MKVYLELFWIFFKIGAFTLGGGYAMVPLIQAEIVDKKNWIKEEEFVKLLALAQSSPGALAVNMSVFVGYKIKKNAWSDSYSRSFSIAIIHSNSSYSFII